MFAILMTAALGLAVPAEASPFRLSPEVVPSHYTLALDLDVEKRELRGEESIDLRFARSTRSFRLHAVGLEISRPRLLVGGQEIALTVTVDPEHEMVEFSAAGEIPAGESSLVLSYRGALTEGLSGIYLSRSGERLYIGSQMQATYARQAFPCFDEPSMKATFDLSVTLDAGYTVISNGPLLGEEPAGEGRKRVTFGTSPRMSTYLVALAAGELSCIGSEVDGIPVRVCAAPENGERVAWALEVAEHVLHFYNRWYGIPYPFGKLDMVAIPNYEWGGMENTGAIFYRESSLLFDPATSSPARKRRIAALVSHEIAHQWFGDLVTTAWWDDIWLNEGFASWIAPKPVATMRADWDRAEDDAAEAQSVIGYDALPTTRAILGRAATPGEIKELFDGIAYTKGAAVIRMLEAYVGEETFRRGVNAYIARHANGNARSRDLWKALAEVSGLAVDEIMPTFIEQPGVPVLTFATAAAEGGTRIEVAQERFYISGETRSAGELWKIPVCVRFAGAAGGIGERCVLVTERRAAWTVPGELTWLLGNAGGRGYYRVAYSAEQLAAVAGAAAELTAAERLVLLNDAWAQVEAGRGGVDGFLRLVEGFDGETNRRVIDVLAGALGEIRRILIGDGDSTRFDAWVRSRFAHLVASVGVEPREGDDDDTRSLRAKLFSILASARDPATLTLARARVESYLKDPASVDPSLAGAAFGVAAAHGDAALFDALLAALAAQPSSDAEQHYLGALPEFEKPALVERALAFVEDGRLKLDQYPAYFASLIRNRAARPAAWAYLKTHWSELASRITSFGGRGAVSALASVCEEEIEADVRAFFAVHEPTGAERALTQALEKMGQCRDFRSGQAASFEGWLNWLNQRSRQNRQKIAGAPAPGEVRH